MKSARWISIALLIVAVVIIEEVVRGQYQQSIEILIIESDVQSEPIAQALAGVSRGVLLNLRPDDDDIQKLNADAGARYIVHLKDSEFANKLLERFNARGLDLESLDHTGQWTAMQMVAIEGNLQGVRLLLAGGAKVRSASSDGKPLRDLLDTLAKAEPSSNYPAIMMALQL